MLSFIWVYLLPWKHMHTENYVRKHNHVALQSTRMKMKPWNTLKEKEIKWIDGKISIEFSRPTCVQFPWHVKQSAKPSRMALKSLKDEALLASLFSSVPFISSLQPEQKMTNRFGPLIQHSSKKLKAIGGLVAWVEGQIKIYLIFLTQ